MEMLINVKVKPNKRENKVVLQDDVYCVELKAKPEKGEANKELIKLLSKHFNSNARIVKGLKSRDKVVEIKRLIKA